MGDRLGKASSGASAPRWVALFVMLCHGAAHPALPSAPEDSSNQAAGRQKSSKRVPEAPEPQEVSWTLPPVRFGGVLSYSSRQDSYEEHKTSQSGQTLTLSASTATYIWRPWFSQLNGQLSVSKSTDRSGSSSTENEGANDSNSSSNSAFVTGGVQLSILPKSSFPFNAYFNRSDSRVNSDMAFFNQTQNQRYGFTQRYAIDQGDAALAWNRTSQNGAASGEDIQNTLDLKLSKYLENNRWNFSANHNLTKRETTSEHDGQDNLTLQHSFTPDPTFSVESMVNVSRFGSEFQDRSSKSRFLQLNSNVFWRPEDEPYSVGGGVRAFAIETETSSLNLPKSTFDSQMVNANGYVSYELNPETRLSGTVSANFVENLGVKSVTTNQTLAANYQPDLIQLGTFRYSWGASTSVNNRTGSVNDETQLGVQLSHALSRNFKLESGAFVDMRVSEALSTVDTLMGGSEQIAPTSSKLINHNASVSWNTAHEDGAAMVQVSASDSRTLDGSPDFFQLINLQASSSLNASDFSSWSGSLTLQASRQNEQGASGESGSTSALNQGFITSSGGAISYQNQRAFNVRRLRFVSDLQLNSQDLLPLLNNGSGQEMAVWNNRLMYSIGRTQFQVSFRVSNSSSSRRRIDPVTQIESFDGFNRLNKSIMFSLSRNFGDL